MSDYEHLLRTHAPIPETAWSAIDDEARERLTPKLAARTLVDWSGPGGWRHSAVSLGRVTHLDGPPAGVSGGDVHVHQRQVLPLAEFRVPFTVARAEIANILRGADDPEFDDLSRAAGVAAQIENRAVFHGWSGAGITGMSEATPYEAMTLGTDVDKYPHVVARAVDELRCAGITGPYALAIGPEGYTRIVQSTEHGGHLLFDHLRQVLGGSIVWAPGVEGAVVASTRGGDFLLDVGQDLSVGYSHHDADTVYLYFEETFAFRVVEPDAAIALR